jgi:hypothetical protein
MVLGLATGQASKQLGAIPIRRSLRTPRVREGTGGWRWRLANTRNGSTKIHSMSTNLCVLFERRAMMLKRLEMEGEMEFVYVNAR